MLHIVFHVIICSRTTALVTNNRNIPWPIISWKHSWRAYRNILEEIYTYRSRQLIKYATYCNFFATIEICNILMHPYAYYFKLSISIKKVFQSQHSTFQFEQKLITVSNRLVIDTPIDYIKKSCILKLWLSQPMVIKKKGPSLVFPGLLSKI